MNKGCEGRTNQGGKLVSWTIGKVQELCRDLQSGYVSIIEGEGMSDSELNQMWENLMSGKEFGQPPTSWRIEVIPGEIPFSDTEPQCASYSDGDVTRWIYNFPGAVRVDEQLKGLFPHSDVRVSSSHEYVRRMSHNMQSFLPLGRYKQTNGTTSYQADGYVWTIDMPSNDPRSAYAIQIMRDTNECYSVLKPRSMGCHIYPIASCTYSS